MEELNHKINRMRAKMLDTAVKHNMDLLNPEVIYYSQQLDLLIVQATRLRAGKHLS